MKTIVPNYYKYFKCIADKCQHNCCIGWQIDIDEQTLQYYNGLSSPIGDRIRHNIVANKENENAPAHFKMGKDKRCPFLNKNNLCDIITQLGTEAICDICTNHPRFYNFWTNYTEIGLGLACEQACRIILSQKEKVTFEIIEDDDNYTIESQDEIDLLYLRAELFAILQNRQKSTDERILEMLDYCQLSKDKITFQKGKVNDLALEQLAVYLLYRNYADVIYDGRLEDRINFVAESYCTIRNKWANNNLTEIDDLIEEARKFSEEVEYDTDTWGIEE